MVRFDQPYTRMYRDHHYNRWEQNTLQPVRLVGQMLSCRHRSWIDVLEQDIAYSRSCVQCPFRPQARHSVFAFSFCNRRRRSSIDKCDGRTGYLSLLWPLPLPVPFSFWNQLCTYFWIKIFVPRIGEGEQSYPIQPDHDKTKLKE